MARKKTKAPSFKLYQHFAAITIAATTLLAVFANAGSEDRTVHELAAQAHAEASYYAGMVQSSETDEDSEENHSASDYEPQDWGAGDDWSERPAHVALQPGKGILLNGEAGLDNSEWERIAEGEDEEAEEEAKTLTGPAGTAQLASAKTTTQQPGTISKSQINSLMEASRLRSN